MDGSYFKPQIRFAAYVGDNLFFYWRTKISVHQAQVRHVFWISSPFEEASGFQIGVHHGLGCFYSEEKTSKKLIKIIHRRQFYFIGSNPCRQLGGLG